MEQNKQLVIFGNSEIAACAYEYFTFDSDYKVVAFTVDNAYLRGQDNFLGLPLIPFEQLPNQFSPKKFSAFAAIGSQQLNRLRAKKYSEFKKNGYTLASYISSKAFIWRNVLLGEHVFILEDNTLQPYTKIGNNVILWSGNHIGHSSQIKDNCFITSHVVISGCCMIGKNTFIGVNTSISEGVHIGKDNFIGMNCKIDRSTCENQVFAADKNKPSAITADRFCRVAILEEE